MCVYVYYENEVTNQNILDILICEMYGLIFFSLYLSFYLNLIITFSWIIMLKACIRNGIIINRFNNNKHNKICRNKSVNQNSNGICIFKCAHTFAVVYCMYHKFLVVSAHRLIPTYCVRHLI